MIRRAFRDSGHDACCPRHKARKLRITWVQRSYSPGHGDLVTFLQVVCSECGFAAGIDMMESEAPE